MMTEVDPNAPKEKKENALLSDTSLDVLANAMSRGKMNLLTFYMYLNIPTTTIISYLNNYPDLKDSDEAQLLQLSRALMEEWKHNKERVKERDKFMDLERALKCADKIDMADTIREKYSNNADLTPDSFEP